MIGKTISHYKILEKLGEGGMGEVYLAEDTSLGRKVAVKFLSSDKAAEPEARKRFVHEARAQAMLSHPSVATFHEVGEEQDKVFIVMEYIEGQPLSRLASGEKLSLPQILDLAIQVGEGLQAAHEKGVMHRDINPANILVTSKGMAKITDFGLAKWKGASTITKTGLQMGTDSYMSPEQLEGRRTDFRTDIFSFGVVLYELICARRSFEGNNRETLFYEILYTQPQPLARFCRGVPESLERIVLKCLAKKPEERYQSAADLVADLKALRRTSEIQNTPVSRVKPRAGRKSLIPISVILGLLLLAALAYLTLPKFFVTALKDGEPKRRMLAVLPFDNLGSADDEYFADGITEEITTRLAKIGGLGVISHTSARKYKKTDKTIRQIGAELGADYILEGNIRWAKSGGASRLRINPQLIRVSDDSHLWAENYDAVLNDIFELQSSIAEKVAAALDVALLEPERKSLQTKPTEKLAAYDFYLRANEYSFQFAKARNLQIAVEMYEKAIQLDPKFALAYARLSKSQMLYYSFYADGSEKHLLKAKEAADRALQLQPDLPEGHLALGYYYYFGLADNNRALEEFNLAQKRLPNNSEVFWAIGQVQRAQGSWELAAATLKKSAQLDPASIDAFNKVAAAYLHAGNYPEAERYFQQNITFAPDFAAGYFGKSRVYIAWEGNTKKARQVLQEAAGKVDTSILVSAYVDIDILDGRYREALNRLPASALFVDMWGDHDSTSYFLTKGKLYDLMNQPWLGRTCYDSARSILEARISAPKSLLQEAGEHAELGLAFAGLGRKEEAAREAKEAVNLYPVSKDAFVGHHFIKNLAQVYVMVEDYGKAIDQLQYLLSITSWESPQFLRLDPVWAPLRNHPKFQKLLAEKI